MLILFLAIIDNIHPLSLPGSFGQTLEVDRKINNYGKDVFEFKKVSVRIVGQNESKIRLDIVCHLILMLTVQLH